MTTWFSRNGAGRLLLAILCAVAISSAVSHLVATSFGLAKTQAVYRRIGPADGPQIYCAGSSLLQFGLSWPEISKTFGQGIENWGVGGSSPVEWEISQMLATNSNVMIVGFSVHDLNEYYLCDVRANIVPLWQALTDLWNAKAGWQFSNRVLSQYPLACLRLLFPTAGKSDGVLVGLRKKARKLLGVSESAAEKNNSMVLPTGPVLDFGESIERLSDWPADKALRRLELVRNEVRGKFGFEGPKKLALLRMLARAEERGRSIVVVMPVAPRYARELVNPEAMRSFEATLAQARQAAPGTHFVRLDQIPTLNTDELFSDFIHLNGAGRRIATQIFLKQAAIPVEKP